MARNWSWLCRDDVERRRLVEMGRLLRLSRLVGFGLSAAALGTVVPVIGWLPLVAVGLLAGCLSVLDRQAARSSRPELPVLAISLLIETAVGVGIALSGGPQSPLLPQLALSLFVVAARFPTRVIAVFTAFTVGVLAVSAAVGAAVAGPFAEDERAALPVSARLLPLLIVIALIGSVAVGLATLARTELQFRSAALVDPLTRVLSRQGLADRFAELSAAAAAFGAPLSVLLVDLDHFKQVNDLHGHARGDQVLRATAHALTVPLRSTDLVYRLGGEEFLVLLPGRDATAAERVAQACRAAVIAAAAGGLPVTVSVGVATGVGHDLVLDRLLAAADRALYRAKAEGRNRVVADGRIVDVGGRGGGAVPTADGDVGGGGASAVRGGQRGTGPDVAEATPEELERELRAGLAAGEVEAWYQPIVTLPDGELAGVEALARWRSPRRGLVGPVQFVPIAERSGLVSALGLEMLRQACRQLAAWDADPHCDGPHYVSVNLSPRQLRDPTLPDQVRRVLSETGLAPDRLLLEVTESAVLDDPDQAERSLAALRTAGIGLALDDFGTGHSSLSRLHTLPVTCLKIDRSFVARLDDRRVVVLVDATIRLARGLGLRIVAEGVETVEQARLLADLGCPSAQGHLYSRALAGADLPAWTSARAVGLPARVLAAAHREPCPDDGCRPSVPEPRTAPESDGPLVLTVDPDAHHLAALVRSAVVELDYAVAVLNLRSGAGMTAVALAARRGPGPAPGPSVAATLLGQHMSLADWTALLDAGTRHGCVVVSRAVSPPHSPSGEYVLWIPEPGSEAAPPPAAGHDGPPAWTAYDALFLALHDERDELFGVLSLDLPGRGHHPEAAEVARLAAFARTATADLLAGGKDRPAGRVRVGER